MYRGHSSSWPKGWNVSLTLHLDSLTSFFWPSFSNYACKQSSRLAKGFYLLVDRLIWFEDLIHQFFGQKLKFSCSTQRVYDSWKLHTPQLVPISMWWHVRHACLGHPLKYMKYVSLLSILAHIPLASSCLTSGVLSIIFRVVYLFKTRRQLLWDVKQGHSHRHRYCKVWKLPERNVAKIYQCKVKGT